MTRSPPDLPSFPGALSDEHLALFEQQGYLAWNNVLTPEEVEAARIAIRDSVAGIAFNEAKGWLDIPESGGHTHLRSHNSKFFVQFEPGYVPSEEENDSLELKVRKLMWYEEEAKIFHKIAFTHPAISAVLKAILGENPQMFQSMALVKPPFCGSEKPWHQDNAYFSVTPLDAVMGVWIALDRATIANGCMHVLKGGHHKGPLRHHHDRDCEIMGDRVSKEDATPIELDPGGALFFYGMLPHYTPENTSPDRRRALQYHYHAADAELRPTEEYDRIFAESDGTPASCEAARLAGV